MSWAYLGNEPLARAASALYAQRPRFCALSPYIFMTDPKRTPDVLRSAANLPDHSTLIYRHFGADDKYPMAIALRQICFANNVQFLIARDEQLAMEVGADGLHLPEKLLGHAAKLRARYPDWLLSGAIHSKENIMNIKGLNAAILSPIFPSNSPSAGNPIGVKTLTQIAKIAPLPIFALGGINSQTVSHLANSGVAGIAGVSAFGRT